MQIDLWTVGYIDENDHPKRRLGRPFVFYKVNPEANGYGVPVREACIWPFLLRLPNSPVLCFYLRSKESLH